MSGQMHVGYYLVSLGLIHTQLTVNDRLLILTVVAGLNFAQGLQFIHATLARDQDIVLSFILVATALERAAEAQNGTLAGYRTRLAESPDFYVIHQGYNLTI